MAKTKKKAEVAENNYEKKEELSKAKKVVKSVIKEKTDPKVKAIATSDDKVSKKTTTTSKGKTKINTKPISEPTIDEEKKAKRISNKEEVKRVKKVEKQSEIKSEAQLKTNRKDSDSKLEKQKKTLDKGTKTSAIQKEEVDKISKIKSKKKQEQIIEQPEIKVIKTKTKTKKSKDIKPVAKTQKKESVIKETPKLATKEFDTKQKLASKKEVTKGTELIGTKVEQKGKKTKIGPVKKEPTVRYSDEDLEMFAKVIQEARREALEELQMLRDRLEDLTNYDYAEESMIYSMHMAEQGSEAIEKEKTYAQIQRINDYIKKLDEAMQRIKDKTYGICKECGILIAKERLLAVPITTQSASWKIHKKCPEDGIDRIEPVK